MAKVKRCPSCQRELPLLAVRCKYCGFKLSGGAEDSGGAEPGTSVPPPAPPPARPSAPPPPPPAKKSVDEIPLAKPSGPPGRPSTPPPAPPPKRGGQNRTATLGTLSPVGRQAGVGQASSPRPAGARTTDSPPPPPRSERPGAAPSPEDTGDKWIPDAAEIGEDTSLLDLDADEVEELAPDELLGEEDEEGRDSDEMEVDEDDFVEDEALHPLLRYLVPDETLDGWEERGLPRWLVKVAGKTRMAHAIGAGVVLVGLIAMIIALAASGEEEPEPAEVAAAEGEGGETGAAAQPKGQKKDESDDKPGAASREEKTAPAQQDEEAALPSAGQDCRALADYPSFPWKGWLSSLGAGKDGVCTLFGRSAEEISAELGEHPTVGPSGIDLIPGGRLLEVFPEGETGRRQPAARLLFAGGKLFEIRLEYRDALAGKVDGDELEELLDEPLEKTTDTLGRDVVRYGDGDMLVERVAEKWYGRTLESLVFASKQLRESLGEDLERREKALATLAEGDAALARKKHEEALEKYGEVAEKTPSLGRAHVKRATALVRLERFEEVPGAARKALEVSRDQSARADARGLLGVAALHAGEEDRALSHYKAAAKEDPANDLFPLSVKELENHEYQTDRVALTAARMECLKKKKIEASHEGLLARGNFPSLGVYFDALEKARRDGRWKSLFKSYVRMECR
ncbi:MAG: tetratricopeptide repeat protein [Polyangia bacterium]